MPDTSATPRESGTDPLVPRQAAWVLAGGLLLSLGAWRFAHRLLDQKAAVLFKAEVDREETSLAGRLDQNLEVVRAAQAILDASESVTPEVWESVGNRFAVAQRQDGMRSMGFVPLVAPAQAAALEAAQKRQRPEFRIHDLGPGPFVAPLTLMHPWSKETRSLLGLDLFSIDSRRAAILQSVDSGQAAITDPLPFAAVSAGSRRHPGATIYGPVYQRGAKPTTPDERRAAIRGVVFTSYYVEDLLRHTLRVHPDLVVRVSDGPSDDPERLLFENRPRLADPRFSHLASHQVAARTWSIRYEAGPLFGLAAERHAPRWVLGGGLLLTLVLAGVARLLALRRLKEERLLADLTDSEARFRAVAETTESAILLYWDSITYANPGASTILGRSREELVGMSPLDLIHPDDRTAAGETLQQRKAGELRPRRWEFRVMRPDGTLRWVDLTATTVQFRGQRLVLATALDITERIEAEQARSEIERKLYEARRMQSIGLIAGGLSHDLNNLFTALQGNLSCVEMEVSEDSPARPFLAKIRASCTRATELAQAMLAYAGDAHFRWTRLDLNAMTQVVVAQVQSELKPGQVVLTELGDNLPALEGDPDQLAHALRELLENALEAMPEGGTATFRTGFGPVDLAALHYDFFNPDSTVGPCLMLEVADEGPGMDPEVRRQMFDPFFSTKFTGRGLGLASVHGILRSHKGGIRVACPPGGGTRITLYFPVADADGAPA